MSAASEAIIYSKKICMLGTFGVGKTSLVRRFVHRLFDDTYLSTIGVQIYKKEIADLNSAKGRPLGVNLVIWDLANIESLTPATRTHFNGASAAIVVFDLTRPETFDLKQIHLRTFLEVNPGAQVIFVGNKTDLMAEGPDEKALVAIAGEYDAHHFLTSAKDGSNVDEMFQALAANVIS